MNFWYVKGCDTIKPEWITTQKVRAYAESIKEGETMDGPRGSKVKILRKYRHYAMTNLGTIIYTDLYMFNVRRMDCTDTGYLFTKR